MPIPRSVYCQRAPEWKAAGLGALSVMTAVSPLDGETLDFGTQQGPPPSPEEVNKVLHKLSPDTQALLGRIGDMAMKCFRAGKGYVKPPKETLKMLAAYTWSQILTQVQAYSRPNGTVTDGTVTDLLNGTVTDALNGTASSSNGPFTFGTTDVVTSPPPMDGMDAWGWMADEYVWSSFGVAGVGLLTCLGIGYCCCRTMQPYKRVEDAEDSSGGLAERHTNSFVYVEMNPRRERSFDLLDDTDVSDTWAIVPKRMEQSTEGADQIFESVTELAQVHDRLRQNKEEGGQHDSEEPSTSEPFGPPPNTGTIPKRKSTPSRKAGPSSKSREGQFQMSTTSLSHVMAPLSDEDSSKQSQIWGSSNLLRSASGKRYSSDE
eukprot:Blabericola_migrator_1__667@NODE_1166_length_5229_cov_67_321193_g784_i1_p1_GENE_NODE_1166_length_5229_cov_67_321193_g784_i1NODE_1166_length_5229_cov_67_321193_g784_i1_p1_ORF_typecomplete_len375_score67_43_NODE_1166_length_5229_cov_67_321193_g784_i134434567